MLGYVRYGCEIVEDEDRVVAVSSGDMEMEVTSPSSFRGVV